jgi:hypothetical protein
MSALPTAEDDLLVVGEMGAPVFIVGRQPPGFALGAVGDDRALSHHSGLSLNGSDPSPVKPQERTNSAASFSCLSASSNSSASGCPSQMCASSFATALWKIVNPPPSIQHDEPPRLFLGSQPSGVEEQSAITATDRDEVAALEGELPYIVWQPTNGVDELCSTWKSLMRRLSRSFTS